MDYNKVFNLKSSLTKEEKLKQIYNNGRIVIHHAASGSSLSSIQRDHIRGRGLQDISYHFLINSDGNIFEGRSLEVMGAHAGSLPRSHYSCENGNKVQDLSKDFDYKAIGIMLTGNLEVSKPSRAQYQALQSLVNNLKSRFNMTYISPHKHVRANGTKCPGEELINQLLNDNSSFKFTPDPVSEVNNIYPANNCAAPSVSCK